MVTVQGSNLRVLATLAEKAKSENGGRALGAPTCQLTFEKGRDTLEDVSKKVLSTQAEGFSLVADGPASHFGCTTRCVECWAQAVG